MNPYYMLATIALSMLIYAATVALVALLGVPVIVAMVLVYAVMMWFMFGMQKRARQAYIPQERRRSAAAAQGFSTVMPTAQIPAALGFRDQVAANQERAAAAHAADSF